MTAVLANRADDLALSEEAAAMARQLAEPDGRVVFQQHPFRNDAGEFRVGQRDVTDGHDGRHGVEPYRQLLAYGLGIVVKPDDPYVVRHPVTDRPLRTYPWAIVLTDRGEEWVAGGCPLDVLPPATTMRKGRGAVA